MPTRDIKKASAPEPASWKKRLGKTALVLLLGGAVTSAWFLFRPDPHLAKVKEMREQMNPDKFKDMTGEQRRDFFQTFRAEMDHLSPQQRAELDAKRREQALQDMRQFFRKSKEEQLAEIRKRIEEGEQRRQQWEARRQERMAQQGGQGGQGGPGGPGGPGGQGGQGQNGGAGRGGSRGGDANQRFTERLDSTTPEFRGQMIAYREMEKQVRAEMGLPITGRGFGGPGIGGPPGGFGGFGGRGPGR
jgi:hypothetical protein